MDLEMMAYFFYTGSVIRMFVNTAPENSIIDDMTVSIFHG